MRYNQIAYPPCIGNNLCIQLIVHSMLKDYGTLIIYQDVSDSTSTIDLETVEDPTNQNYYVHTEVDANQKDI